MFSAQGISKVGWRSRLAGVVGVCGLRVDGPDFQEQAAIQTRVACGDLRSFVEVVCENEPVPANHLLGFAKRAVCHRFLPRDRLASISEPLPSLHRSLVNQTIEPVIEPVDCILYFISPKGIVPLSAGNYQVFG
jgi:hypothetical protein